MDTIIAALMPILLMIFCITYLSFSIKRKKGIESEIKIGYRCYNCTNETTDEEFYDYVGKNMLLIDNEVENLKVCKKCSRDIKIAKVVDNKPYKEWLLKFKRIIFSKKAYNKLIYSVFAIYMLFMVAYFVSMYYDNKIVTLQYTYNFFLTIYWLILLYKLKISYIKKPSI